MTGGRTAAPRTTSPRGARCFWRRWNAPWGHWRRARWWSTGHNSARPPSWRRRTWPPCPSIAPWTARCDGGSQGPPPVPGTTRCAWSSPRLPVRPGRRVRRRPPRRSERTACGATPASAGAAIRPPARAAWRWRPCWPRAIPRTTSGSASTSWRAPRRTRRGDPPPSTGRPSCWSGRRRSARPTPARSTSGGWRCSTKATGRRRRRPTRGGGPRRPRGGATRRRSWRGRRRRSTARGGSRARRSARACRASRI